MFWKHAVFFGILLGALSTASAAQSVDVDNYRSEDSGEIPVGQVPASVMQAALDAKPGVYITRVTRDLEADDDHYYTFEASQTGRYWIIVVRADGTVTKVREEEDPPPPRND